jgi:hypothetical protein
MRDREMMQKGQSAVSSQQSAVSSQQSAVSSQQSAVSSQQSAVSSQQSAVSRSKPPFWLKAESWERSGLKAGNWQLPSFRCSFSYLALSCAAASPS